ncbi:hypothetical protein [Nostoc sp.]|uniref:hypothetical protein n=1 Tax=Nostoc sp. TaxID=1180 RepID=UPI002FF76414
MLTLRVRSLPERAGTPCLRRAAPTHIYYLFSSTLLASCSEAMTERCELAAEFYSVGST